VSTHEPRLAAEVIRPGDDQYDDAAKVFFATGRPAAVVRPRTIDQVVSAVGFAVRRGRPLSVRSGGHSPLGHSTNVDGVVIDLARLDGVEVLDADRRLVRVGGGATWGKVAAALDPYGWGITSGDTAAVGVGGLTLGGGVGWMVRKHGLTIDNLVGARVVTAAGELVEANRADHPDLFWALRGGGGNFGVVVDFDFVAQPVTTVHHGTVVYELDDAGTLLTRWRDAMRAAPDELSSTLALLPRMPDAPPTAMVLLCHAGGPGCTVEDADAVVEPLLELGTVLKASIAERRYADVLEDATEAPPGLRLVARNTLLGSLDEAAIGALADFHATPAPTAIAVRSLGGAFGRVPADATAFAHRAAEAMVVGGLMLPATATDEDVAAALVPWEAVAALGIGTYVNFQGSATADDVAAAYPPATYARLAEVKATYDPGNVFALNHNVVPATEATDDPAA
jgi:FAD/FMN-containing dehydrogenase